MHNLSIIETTQLKYIICNYLYNSKKQIEVQRLREKWFNKNGLKEEYQKFSYILLDKEKLFNFLIKNNIDTVKDNVHSHDVNVCLNCSNETKFVSIGLGYKKYCSHSCAAKYNLNLELTQQTMLERYGVINAFQMESTRIACQTEEVTKRRIKSLKSSNLEKYGVEYTLQLKEFRGDENRDYDDIVKKFKATNLKKYGVECTLHTAERREYYINNGLWLKPEDLSDYKQYKRKVWQYTNKNNIKELENIKLRGRNKYHLDHKFSIFEGFKNNIPTYIIGNLINLEMLPEFKNISKGKSCSITKEELISSFFEVNEFN